MLVVSLAHVCFFVLGYLHGKSASNRRIALGIEPIRFPNGMRVMVNLEKVEEWPGDETVN